MDDLTAFITARLDEDEAALRDDDDDQPGELRFRDMDDRTSEYTWTFANNDRVKREVAAKRAMVERYHDAVDTQGEYGVDGSEYVAERMLKCVAAVWPDHPDYKQEWAT